MLRGWLKTLLSHLTFGRLAVSALGALILVGGAVYAAVNVWPDFGAQAVEVLRGIVGEQAVAAFEDFVFQVEDTAQRWEYQLTGGQPSAPWTPPTPLTPPPASAPVVAVAVGSSTTAVPPAATSNLMTTPQPPEGLGTPGPYSPGTPVAASQAAAWEPAPVQPLGSLAEEGQWSAYIYPSAGDLHAASAPVAYRTYLLPDPARPYAVVSIVAFDLAATRLNFVLGSEEPASTFAVRRPGTIPAADLQPGRLLAAFNGGFKTEHGHFGVMIRGMTLVPPRYGFGTVALFADGHVQMGAWGIDLKASPDMVWWRQNGPLLIQDGRVNPHTEDNAPEDWGYTVKGGTATWRSALGISADGGTLYYAAGPSLTIPALTRAMAAAGAAQAIQLDINPYWTHFDAFQVDNGTLTPVPLVAAMGAKAADRYLKGFSRDYFYVTTAP
jgi:prepilin-type processing-associated H-X9-DG protein